MLDLTTPIIPYKGTGIFELYADYNDVVARMQVNNIEYTKEIREHTDTIDPPWTILTVGDDDIELFFAKSRLWKIVLLNNFKGALPNGINLDTPIEDAEKIDPLLTFNDWDEIYESPEGYWLEHSFVTEKLSCISIFIPAVETDDFYEYNW